MIECSALGAVLAIECRRKKRWTIKFESIRKQRPRMTWTVFVYIRRHADRRPPTIGSCVSSSFHFICVSGKSCPIFFNIVFIYSFRFIANNCIEIGKLVLFWTLNRKWARSMHRHTHTPSTITRACKWPLDRCSPCPRARGCRAMHRRAGIL